MVSTKVSIGFAVLLIGSAIGFFGAATPVVTASQQTVQILNTTFSVAPNDYATQSLELTQGDIVHVAMSIDNRTMFTLDIMNQNQYYTYNNCAPRCAQPLLGGNGTYYQQAGEADPTQLNVTVSQSSSYSGDFRALTNGTYYFVFDNTIGPTWSSYVNQNATGDTSGNFSLFLTESVSTHSMNWTVVGLGAVLTLSGGGAATAFWGMEPRTKGAYLQNLDALRTVNDQDKGS